MTDKIQSRDDAQGSFEHICSDIQCPCDGKPSASSCRCHKTKEQMMRERIAYLEALASQPPAAPVEMDRKTFTIPPGYEAVRDSEGRATGEVRPTAAPVEPDADLPTHNDVRGILPRSSAAAPVESGDGARNAHSTLWSQIAAIYGELDAEDCAWIDREWAKMRGIKLADPVEPPELINRLLTYADNCKADGMIQAEADLRAACDCIIGTKSAINVLKRRLKESPPNSSADNGGEK